MQTIRHYFYRSVKNVFFIITSFVAILLLVVVTDWLLPVEIHNGLVIMAASSLDKIAVVMGLSICLFFGYKAVQVIKTEKSPKQEFMKMIPATIVWLIALLSVVTFIAKHDSRIDCQKFNYNDKLNGGIKEFNGTKYNVNICGSGVNNSPFFGDGMDFVQLIITSEQDDVLVRRSYNISWDGKPGHEPITIGKESITYQDDEKQRSYTIEMPPTLLDWVHARVPLFSIRG